MTRRSVAGVHSAPSAPKNLDFIAWSSGQEPVVLLREHPGCLRALVEVVATCELLVLLKAIDSAVRVVDPAQVRLDLALAPLDERS